MADATDLTPLSWLELARLVHTGDVSRLEVLAAHVDHVERRNAEVNAVVEPGIGVGQGQAALCERERGA